MIFGDALEIFGVIGDDDHVDARFAVSTGVTDAAAAGPCRLHRYRFRWRRLWWRRPGLGALGGFDQLHRVVGRDVVQGKDLSRLFAFGLFLVLQFLLGKNVDQVALALPGHAVALQDRIKCFGDGDVVQVHRRNGADHRLAGNDAELRLVADHPQDLNEADVAVDLDAEGSCSRKRRCGPRLRSDRPC